MTSTHKDLIVWQKSMDLAAGIYSVTRYFPKSEEFGLTSQMRRAVVSIPSNIAEGYGRVYGKETLRFLNNHVVYKAQFYGLLRFKPVVAVLAQVDNCIEIIATLLRQNSV